MRRFAFRRDANEAEIVKGLRAIGWSVMQLNRFDILVGARGVNVALECKDGNKPASARKLTPSQVKLRNEWRGQWDLVTSLDQATAVVYREIRRLEAGSELQAIARRKG